jgi:tight adherence protein C
MLLFFALVCFATAAYYVGEIVTAPARERQNLVTRATQYGRMRVIHGRELPRFSDRVIAPVVSRLAALMLKLNPRTTVEGVSAKLMAAGMRTTSPSKFLAAKAALGFTGLFLGILFASSVGGMKGVLVVTLATVLGFYAPTYIVTVRARRRQESVSADLPDALDLLAVSVEAGLGFDGAIAKLTEHMDGPLIEEFELALGEIRVGEGRADALKKMAERVPAQEMASFVRAIVQADQLGISLGRLLRVQATDARLKRQAAAEEKAMKAPIKMLFPMVVFIFPAMFIVILGPALLNLGQLFKL